MEDQERSIYLGTSLESGGERRDRAFEQPYVIGSEIDEIRHVNEYWPDIVFPRIVDELADLMFVQGPVLPCPRVAREDLYRLTLTFSSLGDNPPETTAYRYVEAYPHSKK